MYNNASSTIKSQQHVQNNQMSQSEETENNSNNNDTNNNNKNNNINNNIGNNILNCIAFLHKTWHRAATSCMQFC